MVKKKDRISREHKKHITALQNQLSTFFSITNVEMDKTNFFTTKNNKIGKSIQRKTFTNWIKNIAEEKLLSSLYDELFSVLTIKAFNYVIKCFVF